MDENKALLYFKTGVLVVFAIHFDFFICLYIFCIGTYEDNEAFSHKLSRVNIILTKVL